MPSQNKKRPVEAIRKNHIPKVCSARERLRKEKPESASPIVLAKVNDRIRDLAEPLPARCSLEWIELDSPPGRRAYELTLCLVLIHAVNRLYPAKRLIIDHSLGLGFFCKDGDEKAMRLTEISRIRDEMKRIIRRKEKITPVTLPREKALSLLNGCGIKPRWIGFRNPGEPLTLHRLGETVDYMGHPLLPSTEFLEVFDLVSEPPGMILRLPDEEDRHRLPPYKAQKKLLGVFQEYGLWEHIVGINNPGDLNRASDENGISRLIKIAEGLHEKRIAALADRAMRIGSVRRIILISGPSSSGKTTFTKRLDIQLRVNGARPLSISLDDYFLDRSKTPLDQEGKPDYESLHALDIRRFNRDLAALLQGRKVRVPRYDFIKGVSDRGPELVLEAGHPVIVEGLHSLNDELTPDFPRRMKFKIYASDLTQLNITDHLRVPTSDVRLLRRMIRDCQFRNHSVQDTLKNWPAVRRGENRHIFPFQEKADEVFNSTLCYEIGVLRKPAMRLLKTVEPDHPEFPEAVRLRYLLDSFLDIPGDWVPPNSILREFIGGSSFEY
ncbi:nucleoside kinase [bacterium]|nr:nucleoside kinase [bacterium]